MCALIGTFAFPNGSVGKESTCKGDVGSIPGSGRYTEEETGNPLQHSFLGNPMDRGVCWSRVHGVTEESDTTYQLNNNNNEKIKCEVTGLRAHPSGSTHLPGLW